jgi:hypothetical protein
VPSISFVVIVLLLPKWLPKKWWLRMMSMTIMLDLLGLERLLSIS